MAFSVGLDAAGVVGIVGTITAVGAITGPGAAIAAATLATSFIFQSSKVVYDFCILVSAITETISTGGFTTKTLTFDKSNALIDYFINFTILE